jgi:hypothetical protein
VETGEYHHEQISRTGTSASRRAGVVAQVIKPSAWSTAVPTTSRASSRTAPRQAVQAALDMEPIMAAGFGHKDFYRIDPALMFPEQPAWYSKVSGELYTEESRTRAEAFAGGWLQTPSGGHDQGIRGRASALVASTEVVGMKVDLGRWALVQRRNKAELPDISRPFHLQSRSCFQHRGRLHRPGRVSA